MLLLRRRDRCSPSSASSTAAAVNPSVGRFDAEPAQQRLQPRGLGERPDDVSAAGQVACLDHEAVVVERVGQPAEVVALQTLHEDFEDGVAHELG